MAKSNIWIPVPLNPRSNLMKKLDTIGAEKINAPGATLTDLYAATVDKQTIQEIEGFCEQTIRPKYKKNDRFTYLDHSFTVKEVQSACIDGTWQPVYVTVDGHRIYESQLK